MKRLQILAIMLALLLCASCTSLKNTKVTEENKNKIMARIGNGNEVTDEERHLLVEYTMRYNMASILSGQRPELPTGKTVGQMIDEQRKWDAEHPQGQAAGQPGH